MFFKGACNLSPAHVTLTGLLCDCSQKTSHCCSWCEDTFFIFKVEKIWTTPLHHIFWQMSIVHVLPHWKQISHTGNKYHHPIDCRRSEDQPPIISKGGRINTDRNGPQNVILIWALTSIPCPSYFRCENPGICFHDSGTNDLAIRDFNSPDLSDAFFPTGKNSRKAPTESATAMPTIAPISALHGNPATLENSPTVGTSDLGDWMNQAGCTLISRYLRVHPSKVSKYKWLVYVSWISRQHCYVTNYWGLNPIFWMFKSHYNVPFQDIFPFSNKAHIILLLLVCPVKYTHDVLWFGSWILRWPKQKYCILVMWTEWSLFRMLPIRFQST